MHGLAFTAIVRKHLQLYSSVCINSNSIPWERSWFVITGAIYLHRCLRTNAMTLLKYRGSVQRGWGPVERSHGRLPSRRVTSSVMNKEHMNISTIHVTFFQFVLRYILRSFDFVFWTGDEWRHYLAFIWRHESSLQSRKRDFVRHPPVCFGGLGGEQVSGKSCRISREFEGNFELKVKSELWGKKVER